jgi:ATP-dependent helicase/nuclease subunit B
VIDFTAQFSDCQPRPTALYWVPMTQKTLHIFPSTAVCEACNRQLLERNGILFGTVAVTLKRLAEEIAGISTFTGRLLSTVGRRLVLENSVRTRYASGTGHLAALKDFPGFVGALDGFIGELKQSLIDAPTFTAAVRRIPGSERLTELAVLYDLYTQALAERGADDGHDRELAALSHLREGGALPTLFAGISRVRCSAVYDFTPLQLAIIAELSRRLPVEIRVPYAFDRTDLFSYVSRTVDAIEALDDTALNLELTFAEPEGTFLTPVIATIFGSRETGEFPRTMPPAAVIATPGTYQECEEIGRRIRGLLEDGTDPVAIAVLFRDTRNYAAMMEDVCNRFSIPVSYRRGMQLSASSLVRTVLAPFEIVAARYGREELLALLKSSYFHPLHDSFGESYAPDSVEELLLAVAYIDENLEPLESRVGKWIAAGKKQGRSYGNGEKMLRALGRLMDELRGFADAGTPRKFIRLVEKFIENHGLYAGGIEAADERALKRDASAITLLQKVLDNLETDIRLLGMDDITLPPADFLSLVQRGMEGEFLAGERQAGVAIMNFHDARGLHFDHVFIGGLNEGVCPANQIGNPLFKDGEKKRFNDIAGKRIFTTAAEKALEEPLLFCLAVGCAVQSLTFSYSYADAGGNGMLCSPFLDEIREALGPEEERIPAGRVTQEISTCLEREELLNSLAANGVFNLPPGVESAGLSDSLSRIAAGGSIEAQREAFFNEENIGLRAGLSTPYTGAILREDILSELKAWYESPSGNTFAPTTLEEYGCCPFRYFLKRLVKLSPVEKPDLELEVREEGSLVHEVLHSFFTRLKAAGKLPLTGSAEEMTVLGEESERVFARWEAEKYTGEKLLWEMEKDRLRLILRGVVEAEAAEESGFVPHAFELPFNRFEVEVADGTKFFLKGKIDRVDFDPAMHAVRVVDYKMAANSRKYGELLKKDKMGETSFQMPVYLLAAAAAMEREFGVPCARLIARYWLLRKLISLERELGGNAKEDFTGFFATDAAERRALGEDNFLNRVCAKVESMKRGDFQITPRECEFCDFAAVCRYVEVGLKEEE